MFSLEAYERVYADCLERKQEIEARCARELTQIESMMEGLKALMGGAEEHMVAPTGHTGVEPPAGKTSLADLGVGCLKSVAGAWLSAKEMAQRLVAAGTVRQDKRLVGHMNTALKRRMQSRDAASSAIEFADGRFRWRS